VSELNLVLLGPPGAGKGTQGERLREEFDELADIQTGNMMRARKDDPEIAKYLAAGELVPDDVVCKVLLEKVDAEGDDGFLMDGFPRKESQADVLDEALTERGRSITAVLLIEADDETVVRRISGRRTTADGHIVHIDALPEGIDESTLTQRDDDKPDVIRNRLAIYHAETEPLIKRYEDAGVLHRFDGEQTTDEVYEHIRKTLRTLKLEQDT
jgi:adenylate kinase